MGTPPPPPRPSAVGRITPNIPKGGGGGRAKREGGPHKGSQRGGGAPHGPHGKVAARGDPEHPTDPRPHRGAGGTGGPRAVRGTAELTGGAPGGAGGVEGGVRGGWESDATDAAAPGAKRARSGAGKARRPPATPAVRAARRPPPPGAAPTSSTHWPPAARSQSASAAPLRGCSALECGWSPAGGFALAPRTAAGRRRGEGMSGRSPTSAVGSQGKKAPDGGGGESKQPLRAQRGPTAPPPPAIKLQPHCGGAGRGGGRAGGHAGGHAEQREGGGAAGAAGEC